MEKITVTNARIVTMLNGLTEYGKKECDSDLLLLIGKNITILKPLAIEIVNTHKQSLKYNEYVNKLLILDKSFSLKDKKGKPIVDNNTFVMDSGKLDMYENKVDVLEHKYQEHIDKESLRLEKYTITLEKTQSFKIYKIPWSMLKEKAKPNTIMMFVEIME